MPAEAELPEIPVYDVGRDFPIELARRVGVRGYDLPEMATSGVARFIANHLHLAVFESAPEVRVLCSAGITRPRRSNDPVRLPPWPSPFATLRTLPSPANGSPPITTNHLSDVPCPLVWGFFCQASPQGLIFFLRQFLCSIWSPFLRPDPQIPGAVARRGCQGWPSRQHCHALPSSPGHTLTAPSTAARLWWSG